MARMADDPTTSGLRADADERERAPRGKRGGAGFALLGAALVAAAGWWWWSHDDSGREAAPTVADAPAAAPAPAAPVADAGPRYPLQEPSPAQPFGSGDIGGALTALLGQAAVTTFLHVDDFPRRVVATVDNLGRAHAPPALWPVVPTPGRFTVEAGAEGEAIAARNAQRYAPFVRMVAGVDAARAAALYRQAYPLLQQAYRDQGFGDRYFNDRLVEVIDLLLATPEPATAPQVQLTEVKGPIAPERPWVRFEFADPRLESISAGQKMLVRMGPENARQLRRKLAEFRAQVATAAGSR